MDSRREQTSEVSLRGNPKMTHIGIEKLCVRLGPLRPNSGWQRTCKTNACGVRSLPGIPARKYSQVANNSCSFRTKCLIQRQEELDSEFFWVGSSCVEEMGVLEDIFRQKIFIFICSGSEKKSISMTLGNSCKGFQLNCSLIFFPTSSGGRFHVYKTGTSSDQILTKK